MALHRRGKQNYYHAYFYAWERTETGLKRVRREVNLYTTDVYVARTLENTLMERNRKQSDEARAAAKIEAILTGNTVTVIHAEPRRRRLKLTEALKRAERYRSIGESAKKLWRRFEREAGVVYLDEVTPQRALAYLEKVSPNGGKYYNNARSALNGIFKLLLVETGLSQSPFDPIRPSRVSSLSQRPFTREEYARILDAAPEPWHTASLIAWHTGLREADVFALRWSFIDGDTITTLPRKTARFGRSVQIPIHPQLADALARLPRPNDYVLGQWSPAGRVTPSQRRTLAELFAACDIRSDARGLVKFNSLRDSFITRLDAANIPRHAIRGMVGHTTDDMTDLYSWDLSTARRITALPAPTLPS